MARERQGWVSLPVGDGNDESSSKLASGQPGTFIDQGAEFDGVLRSRGSVRIDGEFRGEVIAEDAVIAGESAAVQATVRARRVLVSGAVVGRVEASREVVLRSTARLHADVETPCFEMERGAVLNGRTTMHRPEQRAREATGRSEAAAAEGAAAAPGA